MVGTKVCFVTQNTCRVEKAVKPEFEEICYLECLLLDKEIEQRYLSQNESFNEDDLERMVTDD
jgi:hypothetical protein